MICIDFQGGAHGNFLEFVCNKFIGQTKTKSESPFDQQGASHAKNYVDTDRLFKAHHFSFGDGDIEMFRRAERVISIQITHDDLLPLSEISLLRANDLGIDNNLLEINTYNKLNNKTYRWVLDNLLNNFFKNQIRDSYNAIKDESWPLVESIDDFNNLPRHIQDECTQIHKIKLHTLSKDHPDCSRKILREFFKFSFKFPSQSGFVARQQQVIYGNEINLYVFPFGSFYNTDQFIEQMNKISQWVGMPLTDLDSLVKLHSEFLARQPYKDSKYICDSILEQIYNRQDVKLSSLDLMKESYISAHIESKYNIEILDWFDNSLDLYEYIDECRH